MQTTAPTTKKRGALGPARLLLAAVALALLAAASPRPAGAEQMPTTAGTNQALACEMMGGWPTVDVTRTGGGVVTRVLVTCTIPGLGGWWCVTTPASQVCEPIAPSRPGRVPGRWADALNGVILPALETGSVTQMQTAVAAVQASVGFQVGPIGARGSRAAEHEADPRAGEDGGQGKRGKGGQRKR